MHIMLTHARVHTHTRTHARRDTTLKLNRKIEDLEDVRGIMAVLKEVREKESEIDNLIGPIEEMYALLLRYEVSRDREVCRQWLLLGICFVDVVCSVFS